MRKGLNVFQMSIKESTAKKNQPPWEQNAFRFFLGKPVHIRDDGRSSPIHFQNERGHPQPTARTGYHSQVSIWAREEQFQSHTLSTHRILRPVLTVSIGLKQASTIVVFQFTLLWERSGADYKGPHWYKREKLPNISDTDEDQRAFVLPHSNETTDDNGEQTAMITLLHSFFFFKLSF